MVCFVRRSTIDYDIRLKKYVDACVETKTPYVAITWDRQKNCSNVYPNEIQYKASAPYGAKWKNLFSLIGWQFFMLWMLLMNWSKYKVIHACNLEVFIFVLPLRLFGKKIVFDIYDSVNVNVEKKISKYADILILPHKKRLEQIHVTENELKMFLVVENVPKFNRHITKKDKTEIPQKIHLSYVGVLERNIRGLENLLDVVADDERFMLNIAGIGGGLEALVNAAQAKCNRIKYYGKVNYDKALDIMNQSDFIVAQYYSSHTLHQYASPNKYYESLYLHKPIITSKNTLVGVQVEENNTGYVIDDTKNDFLNIFSNIDSLSFEVSYDEKSNNCKKLWEGIYQNYFEKTIKGEYINLLKLL